MRKIDIIIPVYKPDQKFLALVDKLEHQTVAVNKIIIMNTERQYFDRLVKGTSFFEKYQNVCVINLKKEDFDHGLTRRQGVEQSDAQVFVMMTMDAMPVDTKADGSFGKGGCGGFLRQTDGGKEQRGNRTLYEKI